jgi:MoaA/NifB/PqqE/SkfB family radical SAM enzyme
MWTEKQPFPVHLDIESTNACQLKCPMCPRVNMTRKIGFMSWDTLTRILVEAQGRTKDCFLHQFGEPLLHPEIVPMIRAIKTAGIWVSMSTNGVLLTGSKANEVLRSGIDQLTIDLDALAREDYEFYRPGARYEEVLANIETCLRLQEVLCTPTQISLQMIDMNNNQQYIEEFRRRYEVRMKALGGELLVKPFVNYASRVPKLSSKYPLFDSEWHCWFPNYSLTIQWNGDCCVCCQDCNAEVFFGNIHLQPIKQIWDGTELERLREVFQSGKREKTTFCRGCSHPIGNEACKNLTT